MVNISLGSGTAALPLPFSQPADLAVAFGSYLVKSHISITNTQYDLIQKSQGGFVGSFLLSVI